PLQLDGTVGQEIVHSRREQQQADQVRLLGVGKLTETYVVQQIVRQLDLSAGALELAEIPKSEKLLHGGLSLAGLDEVDLHDRDRRFSVGFEVDSAELRNHRVVNRAFARTPQDFDATAVGPPRGRHARKHCAQLVLVGCC